MNGEPQDDLDNILNETLQNLSLEVEEESDLQDFDIQEAKEQIKTLQQQIKDYTNHVRSLHQVYQEENADQIQKLVKEMKTKTELQQTLKNMSSPNYLVPTAPSSSASNAPQQLDTVKFNVAGKVFEIAKWNVLKYGLVYLFYH